MWVVFIALLLSPVLLKPGCVFSASQTSQNATAAKEVKFEHAVVRSEDAAKIVALLNEMRDSNFPKELGDRAHAIAVFPLVKQQKMLFMQTTQGYGVISARLENGWTVPAFYQFSGGGYTGALFSESQSAVILIFMDKPSLSWFEKGGVVLKGSKKVIPGPVGVLTDEQKKELQAANTLGYVYSDSHLIGMQFGSTFKSFILNPDNNINKPMYGMKGRQLLAGSKVDRATLPPGLTAFQEALEKYHSKK